jgi:hypothetical protein
VIDAETRSRQLEIQARQLEIEAQAQSRQLEAQSRQLEIQARLEEARIRGHVEETRIKETAKVQIAEKKNVRSYGASLVISGWNPCR